jgi:choline dehydrogenase-like flavoprotein
VLTADPTDVLVIGAGASGAVAALRLVEAGRSVVTLEQGHWPDRASFRGSEKDWELDGRKRWSSVPEVRGSAVDYPMDLSESDMGMLNWNGVGGATVLYNASWLRMLPDDFRTRSVDDVADDWPIGYDDLLPYYERTDHQFGVSGMGGDPAYPPGLEPPLPPLPITEAGLRVARGHARLGWHWWPQPCAIASVPHGGRHPCVQRGTCGQGCNEGAKASTDLTHWPDYLARGGRLVTGARVSRIVVDDDGRAAGAEWLDAEGQVHFQPAKVVICAANGIGTARLLLMSGSAQFPDGLANSSGLVGRRLMLHPHVRVIGLFDEDLGSWQGSNGALMVSFQFYGTDRSRGFVRGAKWTLSPTGGPLGISLAAQVWGADHHDHVRRRLGRSVGWTIMCEDLPDEDNRVTLSPDLVDSSGLPAPKIRYRHDENMEAMIAFNVARATESLLAAGATEVETVRTPMNGHFMGTARMGHDPATSVVDPWGMCHDVPNLAIVDGSVFVTSSGVNPTSTIAAFALRTAEHILDRQDDLLGPAPSATTTPSGVAVSIGASRTVLGPEERPEDLEAVTSLGEVERQRLADLADCLLPGDDRMPSARDVGVAGALLDEVLASRPDLARPLVKVLSVPVGDPVQRLAELATSHPRLHAALLTAVAGGYYLSDVVRDALGYPGQVAIPVNPLEFPAYLEEGLLDHLITEDEAAAGA